MCANSTSSLHSAREIDKGIICLFTNKRLRKLVMLKCKIFIWEIENSHERKIQLCADDLDEKCLEKLNLEFERFSEFLRAIIQKVIEELNLLTKYTNYFHKKYLIYKNYKECVRTCLGITEDKGKENMHRFLQRQFLNNKNNKNLEYISRKLSTKNSKNIIDYKQYKLPKLQNKTNQIILNKKSTNRQQWSRLAFLGDRIFNFEVARILYSKYPEANSHGLTQLSQLFITRKAMSEIAQRINLKNEIIVNEPDNKNKNKKVNKNRKKKGNRKKKSNKKNSNNNKSNNKNINKNGCWGENLEAYLAAMFLEGKQNEIKEFVEWVNPLLQQWSRLAFLGDRIFNFEVARILYSKYPEANSHGLTQLSQLFITRKAMSEIAQRINLKNEIIVNEPDNKNKNKKVNKNRKKKGNRKKKSNKKNSNNNKSNNKNINKNGCWGENLEAYLAAMFLEGKQNEIKEFVEWVVYYPKKN
ncbi:hypothetical protein Glove_114g163 [Diversispora epigaea]|uniref:RNase III domain-containing protein n=1 Tax=Diversispora epigaea TaxID=1348612 RepID=A0A397JAV7_9GLOM|nr:hypothetical protein Glove_114g163 [Diversispora epigaea]